MLRLFKQANERIPKLLILKNEHVLPLESENFFNNEDVYLFKNPPSNIRVFTGYDNDDEDLEN